MTDYTRKPTGHECPPPEHPAEQPKLPGGKCDPLPTTDPPELKAPDKCDPPPCECNCPKDPPPSSNCLEVLIDEQTQQIAVAEKATALKTELVKLLANAKDANKEYTRENYDKAITRWKDQDKDIVKLLTQLVCAVPC